MFAKGLVIMSGLQSTVKHSGGSLQVWGSISANGIEDLLRITGPQCLETQTNPSYNTIKEASDWSYFFCSRTITPNIHPILIKTILNNREIGSLKKVMVWLSRSSNHNIIESCLELHKETKKLWQPIFTEEFWLVLQDKKNLPDEFQCVQVYLKELMLFHGQGWSHQILIKFRFLFSVH